MPNNPNQAISEVREALSKIPEPDFPRPAWWAERAIDVWSQVNEGHGFQRWMVADCVPHHLAPLIVAMNPDNARAILEDHDRLTKRVAELATSRAELLDSLESAQGTIDHLISYGGGTDGFGEFDELITRQRAAISRSTT